MGDFTQMGEEFFSVVSEVFYGISAYHLAIEEIVLRGRNMLVSLRKVL